MNKLSLQKKKSLSCFVIVTQTWVMVFVAAFEIFVMLLPFSVVSGYFYCEKPIHTKKNKKENIKQTFGYNKKKLQKKNYLLVLLLTFLVC